MCLSIYTSKNLISAIEQGIVTKQTKERLKELEAQISQYEFDIEQEKQIVQTFSTASRHENLRSIKTAF